MGHMKGITTVMINHLCWAPCTSEVAWCSQQRSEGGQWCRGFCTSFLCTPRSCRVTHASSPSSALSSAGICGHCSQRLPPPLLDVTGCRAAAARLGLHSHKDSTLFYFYTSTQMCLSGSCFSGNLYLLSFPGLFSHACHPFPSRTYCSLTKGFLN